MIKLKKKNRELKKLISVLKKNYIALKISMTPLSTKEESKGKSQEISHLYKNRKILESEGDSMAQNLSEESKRGDADIGEEELVNFEENEINIALKEYNEFLCENADNP